MTWLARTVIALCAALAPLVVTAQTSGAAPPLVVRPEPLRDAWWQRATLNPRSLAVHGMPIKRLEPAWCAADALTRELYGEELLGPTGGSPVDGLAFELEASLDGSGKPQTAFVGAYRRCDGERGLFLVIIDRPGERPRMRFLVEVPDPGSAIAALSLEPDGSLAVWWCGACDSGNRIAYNRATRSFYVAGPATRRP